MHILERYALGCGVRIAKPFMSEEFFPMGGIDKYIVIHASSGMESKNFDYFDELIYFLKPYLDKENIEIVQIGGPNDPKLNDCIHALGTTKRQMAYKIKHSLLYFGNDTFSVHLASFYGKKIVCTSTVLYKQNFYPYWSNKEDYVIIESDREGKKPSFTAVENPKTINFIKPEDMASPILDYLGIDHKIEYETLTRGPAYIHGNIQCIPNEVTIVNDDRVDNMIMRMDLVFNEGVLLNQLAKTKCSVITNRPINLEILKSMRSNVSEVVYEIDENHSPDFMNELKRLGVPTGMISKMPEEDITNLKLYYMDHGIIHKHKTTSREDREEIKSHGINNLFYFSKKFFIDKGVIFPSIAAWKEGASVNSTQIALNPAIDSKWFWDDAKDFYLLKKTT